MTLTINADGTVTVSGFPSKRAEPTAVEQSADIAHAVHCVAADALSIDVYGTTMPDTVAALARAYRKARVQVAEAHAERVSYADLHRAISEALGLTAPTDAQLVAHVTHIMAERDAAHIDASAARFELARFVTERRDADIAAAASVAAPQGGYAAGRAGALAEAATFRRRVCDALELSHGAPEDVVVERAETLVERARGLA